MEPMHPARRYKDHMICRSERCGYNGPPEQVPKGSLAVGVVLCLFFLLPGIVYLILTSGHKRVCPRCGLGAD